jgi:hypothetical protein
VKAASENRHRRRSELLGGERMVYLFLRPGQGDPIVGSLGRNRRPRSSAGRSCGV